MKKLIFYGLSAMLSAMPFTISAQPTDEHALKEIVESRNFVFVANSAMPLRGMTQAFITQMFLNASYDLTVSGDSVIAELPYFGRAWSAPMNMSGGGIRFVSVDNEYSIAARKKGGWEISIKPEDQRDTRQLNLTILKNGSATLRVNSTFRDPITFNGYVVRRK